MRLPVNLSRTPFLAAVLFGGAASMGIQPSADGDIFWHLAAGREMVARGGLLFSDPFSVSGSGRAWLDVHWLFQLAVYAIHTEFGLAGLVWVKCLLIGVSALVSFAALDGTANRWARPLFVTVLLTALFCSRSLLLMRPVIVSLLFLSVFFCELERYQRDGNFRHLLVLPLCQMLWANFQGLSALGPALLFSYASASGLSALASGRPYFPFAPEAKRVGLRWRVFRAHALTFGACSLALAATPFGAAGLGLPGKLLTRLLPSEGNVYARAVAENVPPFVLERLSGEFWHLKWFFALLLLSCLCAGRHLRLSHALLVVGFALLALISNRNVLLFYWVSAPIAALYLAPVARAFFGRRASTRHAAWAVNAAALSSVLCCSAVAAARETRLDQPSPFRAPRESADRLARMDTQADVFSADQQGGYLIWRLYPRFRPYIDTRLVLRTEREYAEYLELSSDPRRFQAFQAEHHFGYVVLPVAYPDRYLNLIAALYASADWKLSFTNGSEVLFSRADLQTEPAWQLGDPARTDRIVRDIESEFSAAPKLSAAALLHLATLQIALAEFPQAERVLDRVHSPEAEALRGRSRLGAGDLVAAKRIGAALLRKDRDDVSSLNLMAEVALQSGELPESIGFLRRALQIDPFDGEASQILANLEDLR